MENNLIKKIVSPEQNKKYYNAFKETNPDIIKKKFICTVCGGKYTYYNKSKHNKSTKHLNKVII